MKIRKIKLVVFSLIFALVLAYLAYNLLDTVSGEELVVDIEVLAASNEITKADVITNEDIEFDKRSVTIYADQYSAVADLLKPGDRVDLYVFIAEKTKDGEIIHPDISKLMIQNIKVISIDQDTVGSTLPREEIADRYAITLEADYKDAEQIVLAEKMGYLKIALRPMGDDTIYITYGSVWEELVAYENLTTRDMSAEYPTISDIYILNRERSLNKSEEEVVEEEVVIVEEEEEVEVVEEDVFYTVKNGDTLRKIANEFYGDYTKYTLISKANSIYDPNYIVTGTKLRIPKIEE